MVSNTGSRIESSSNCPRAPSPGLHARIRRSRAAAMTRRTISRTDARISSTTQEVRERMHQSTAVEENRLARWPLLAKCTAVAVMAAFGLASCTTLGDNPKAALGGLGGATVG